MPDMLRPATQIAGYELVRPLDAGGMGDVWLAKEPLTGRDVALKFVKPHLLSDPSFHARFLNEARTLARLEHDRIVPLLRPIDADGHLALVLRYIEGESLAKRIDRHGALPLDVVIGYARDILPALGYAHEQGTIHRDIKPPNILIDRQNRAFLTDFGIAVTDVVERNTMLGFSVGSPHYMSPEQIRTPQDITAGPTGRLSDIYSVGVVLYEMLTGTVPFGAGLGQSDSYRVQHAHCVEAPPPLREKNASVPEAIERAVLACLAKLPSDRPQSCADVLRALEAAATRGARTEVQRTGTEVLGRPAPEQSTRGGGAPRAERRAPRWWTRSRPAWSSSARSSRSPSGQERIHQARGRNHAVTSRRS
jgi:serine/threonine-protein kinase